MRCAFLGEWKNFCYNLSYLIRQRQEHQKPCSLRFSLHKFVHLKIFWTLFKNVHCQGPCSLRPRISRPYCSLVNVPGHYLRKYGTYFELSRCPTYLTKPTSFSPEALVTFPKFPLRRDCYQIFLWNWPNPLPRRKRDWKNKIPHFSSWWRNDIPILHTKF